MMTELLKNQLGEIGAELINPSRGVYVLPGRGTIRMMGRGYDVEVIVDGRPRYVGSFERAQDAARRMKEELR
jgi:hypothetical protein